MKKFIPILLLISLLIPGTCFAVDASVTCTDYSYRGLSGKMETRRIVYTYTHATAGPGTAPSNVALDSIVASATRGGRPSLRGWWLLRIDTYPGTTAPTADSDLYLWSVEDKIDVLEDQGADMIDGAATYNTFGPVLSHPLTGLEILDVDNNAVAAAVTYIIFTLYR